MILLHDYTIPEIYETAIPNLGNLCKTAFVFITCIYDECHEWSKHAILCYFLGG